MDQREATKFASNRCYSSNDICMNSNRSTISGKDVLDAMVELELPELIPALKDFWVGMFVFSFFCSSANIKN